jgi:hypothetical protein
MRQTLAVDDQSADLTDLLGCLQSLREKILRESSDLLANWGAVGATLPPGAPVCTVHAQASDAARARLQLGRRRRRVQVQIQIKQETNPEETGNGTGTSQAEREPAGGAAGRLSA